MGTPKLKQIVVKSSETSETDGDDAPPTLSQPRSGKSQEARHAHTSSFQAPALHNLEEAESLSGPRLASFQSNELGHGREGRSRQGKSRTKSHSSSRASKSQKPKTPSRAKRKRGEEYELEGLEDDEQEDSEGPFFKRRSFWVTAGPFFWTILFVIIAVCLKEFRASQYTGNLPLWRFFLFFGLLPPLLPITNYILLAVVLVFESQFFTTTNVLYFVIALKSPARYVIMALLVLPLYIPLFSKPAGLSQGANVTYHRILDAIACVIIFATMNLLKVLLAKLLSSYFHSSTHFAKMQEALDKEYYLKVLATPRQNGVLNNLQSKAVPTDAGAGTQAEAELKKSSSLLSKMRRGLDRNMSVLKRRAASLPTPGSLDNITEDTLAAVEAKKQGQTLQGPAHIMVDGRSTPAGNRTSVDSTVFSGFKPAPDHFSAGSERARPSTTSRHAQQQGFEPPDPVPSTPPKPFDPASPSEGAYLAKHSLPMPGTRAGSTAHPKASQNQIDLIYPALTEHTSTGPTTEQANVHPALTRRNTDGGAGLAGILDEMGPGTDAELSGSGPQGAAGMPVDPFLPTMYHQASTVVHSRGQSFAVPPADIHEAGRSSRRTSVSGTDMWGWKRNNQRTPSVIKEENEPDSPAKLPDITEEMTDDQGNALVSTIHQVEKHIRKRQIGLPFMSQISRDGNSSESEAKKLAFFIFWNVKPFFHRNYVIVEDIQAFMSKRRATEAFAMLDRDGDGQVTLSEMRASIKQILSERQDLAMQLKDTKSVVGKLEVVIGISLHIIAIFFYLMIFGVDIKNVWVLFTSIFVGFAFIFGNSIKNLFEAVLYLFVQHPFDVGDTVIMEDGSRVKVEEIALSMIVMRRADGVRLWVPMTQLTPKTCQNISRSDNKGDSFTFLVDVGISAHVLQVLDKQVGDFIAKRELDFSAGQSIQLTAAKDPMKVALNIGFEFSHNGVDGTKMGNAKSDLLKVISDVLAELKVQNSQALSRTAS